MSEQSLLNQEGYVKKAEELISNIGIPTQPQILVNLNKEINKPGADLGDIADIVSRDVALSAKLLKIVNSAFFGLREKVDSIHRALSLLGLKNFNKIILASSLREALGNHGPGTEKFWNHSMTTATISSHIAKKVGFEHEEQAYVAGLFHDCGVPFLMKKFSDYAQIVDYALSVVPSESLSGRSRSIIGIEEERYDTHHCAIGYLVAKSWRLSLTVAKSVWYHHYIHIDIHKDPSTKRLSAILLLADYIAGYILYLSGGHCSVESESEWANMHKKVLSELSLSIDNIKDLKEDLVEKLYE
jgi:putative nucleotidyltransferase with HDIG domain